MANPDTNHIGVEPDAWFLIFEPDAPRLWLRVIAGGRFKHVSALGWISSQRVWVHYDVKLGRTRVAVMPDCPGADEAIAELRKGNVTICMPPAPDRVMLARVGFWCAPAMGHLVGIRRTVFRPDALYREALKQGAELVEW